MASPPTTTSRARGVAFVLALLALFFGTACKDATGRAPRAPTPGVPNFTVMTFNVHRYMSSDESTVAEIGARNADIVSLQEPTEAWKQVIEARYRQQYPYMLFAPRDDAGGLAVLSHFPLVDRGVISIPGDPGAWHPAWYVLVETPAGPVQVLNVHLRSMFEGDSNFLSNYLSTGHDHTYEMSVFMEGKLTGVPMIITGDFNEGPSGKAVKWTEDRGFQDAVPIFDPDATTWQGDAIAKGVKLNIDRVMFDSAFDPLDAWVEPKVGSDHRAVIAWFEMPLKDDAQRVKVGPSDVVHP
jgi:endonuclease/exonuclease/phosphatase family metal-dependent hydrolase